MLKRLDLVGFKSFADKTEFAFGAGLTAVVGPNGSGKSNVVDAVRWIMGEQSAKSLRGGEMTDVIFNGSATRKPVGMAEVTLVLDNARRMLSFDADEVQLTRRVYRDGQGEYLINRQPARLKDIKDLFLGSGAGTDAYCIIAQGRVDSLLHASNQERRAVFEEAAGISRFRAKKQETQRKLEQTELNLQRLQDIVDELNRQLQSVRQQAAKAQKFVEHQAALKERRVALGLQECHAHAQALARLETALATTQADEARETEAAAEGERALAALEERLAAADRAQREQEAALAELRARLAAAESGLLHESKRRQSLLDELGQAEARRAELAARAEEGDRLADAAAAELATLAEAAEAHATAVAAALSELHALQAALQAGRDTLEQDQAALLEEMRQAARDHNDWVSLKAQSQSLEQHRVRLAAQQEQASRNLNEASHELTALQQAEAQATAEAAQTQTALATLREQIETQQRTFETTRAQLATDRESRSGLASQLQLLSDLEASRDGAAAGVRSLLERQATDPASPWCMLLGTAADDLAVASEHAALLDLALGDRADWLLVPDQTALRHALAANPPLSRVTFLALDAISPSAIRGEGRSEGAAAVEAIPAATLVSCPKPYGPALIAHLFGDLFLVENLDQAYAGRQAQPTARWLTRAGELLTADGALVVGPQAQELGRLARQSRLQELREEIAALDGRLATAEAELESAKLALAEALRQEQPLAQAQAVGGERLTDLRLRLQQQQERSALLDEEVRLGQVELRQLVAELAKLAEERSAAEQQALTADEAVRQRQAKIAAGEAALRQHELERSDRQEQATTAKVAAAQAEERRRAAAAQAEQAERERGRRADELARHERRAETLHDEQAAAAAEADRLAAQVAADQAARAAAEATVREGEAACQALKAERAAGADALHERRERRQAAQQAGHALELKKNETQHQLGAVAARVREEHEVDLFALLPDYTPSDAPLDAAAVQAEIAELKRKLARLGSVNLDSLQELAELEGRAVGLQTQHDDLSAAKASLVEIIEKINEDSRRLFTSTFDSVRVHFQDVFRKLFGGGTADVALENPADVLESGIEIIARPPGKESRNLSLLSGGEKSLTAVALLLAIFRDKPSPFCIMDEVDAALDEANVGRFAALLRDFQDQSQFILISHSKKTMAAADVLYGVTMQEAGVSKRIAVRLEEAAPALAKAA